MSATNPPDEVSALHTITSLALDPQLPLFKHYPAMKLGVRESVRFYAALLLPLVEKIVSSRPEITDWVVTAPPLYAIPAGANLIAWEVFRLLTAKNSINANIRSVDLRYSHPSPPSNNPRGADYSGSGIANRVQNRQALHEGKWAPKPDPADFRGRGVLFINDINVTGTQQKYVRGTLERVEPALIRWLYIFQVETVLGREHPEIEYALNFLNIATFEEFASVLAHADIDYTSRAVGRLFTYSEEELGPFVRTLDRGRRERLYQLVVEEGSFREEVHRAKLTMLQAS
jgi:hypothetical protein